MMYFIINSKPVLVQRGITGMYAPVSVLDFRERENSGKCQSQGLCPVLKRIY